MTPLPVAFGPALAEARRRRSMKQGTLARRLGVAERTVRAWEHGESSPGSQRVLDAEQELGLQKGALLVRLPRRRADPDTRTLSRRCSDRRLDYVVTSVDERFQIGRSALIDEVVVRVEIRALFDLSEPTYFFLYEQSRDQEVSIHPRARCGPGNYRRVLDTTLERRIPLSGGQLRAGRRRSFEYEVQYHYRPGFRPRSFVFRRNTSALLEELTMTVSFPQSGRWLRFVTWAERDQPEYEVRSRILPTTTDSYTWTDPVVAACGFRWEEEQAR
jgi:transcriptional regulator with XRE-family HTH domain